MFSDIPTYVRMALEWKTKPENGGYADKSTVKSGSHVHVFLMK